MAATWALIGTFASACGGDEGSGGRGGDSSTGASAGDGSGDDGGTGSGGDDGMDDGGGDGSGSDTDGSGSAGEDGDSGGTKFDLEPIPDTYSPPDDGEGCKKVDLLFVIDNSGSMADEQINLVNSFPGFISAMQTQLATTESFNVGVVTSDNYIYDEAPCTGIGALVTRTGGANSSNQLCGPYLSGGRYMNELDVATKFSCAAQVGTSGSGNEQPMYAMEQAIGPALAAPGACNEGFLRPDALLVVVVITDEHDDHETMACNMTSLPGSPGEPPDWFDAVVTAKGGIESNVVVLGLIGPEPPAACPALDKCTGGITGAEINTRIIQFINMFTHGSIGLVCAADYGPFFSDAISVISSACENFMPPS